MPIEIRRKKFMIDMICVPETGHLGWKQLLLRYLGASSAQMTSHYRLRFQPPNLEWTEDPTSS